MDKNDENIDENLDKIEDITKNFEDTDEHFKTSEINDEDTKEEQLDNQKELSNLDAKNDENSKNQSIIPDDINFWKENTSKNQKKSKCVVKPRRRQIDVKATKSINENSIIALCNELNNQVLEPQVSLSPRQKKVKSRRKLLLASISIFSIFGVFGLVYTVNDLFFSNQNNTQNMMNPNPATVDIVTNIATDSSLDGVLEGEILSVPQIYEKVSPSTVGIQSDSRFGSGIGTGIIMSEDGYIITNNHVIEDSISLTVALYDGSMYKAQVIGSDASTDLAVIKISPDDDFPLVVAEFGNSDTAIVGDVAITIGNPGGLELQGTLTGGYISAINRDIIVDNRVMTLIQTDAAINPGNSGGPLINQYGQVIGINTIKISADSYEGLGFAIPITDAKPIIDELIAYGYVPGRPSIGITGYNISKEQAEYENIPQGLLVSSVDTRCDAYTKGLKVNDIIIGVNGIETVSVSEINAVKEEYRAGDSILLAVYRSGLYLEIEIELMDEIDLQGDDPGISSPSPSYSLDDFPFYFPFEK